MAEIEDDVYLSGEMFLDKKGQLTIVGEGIYNEQEIKGEKKRLMNVPVQIAKGEDRTWTPNKTSRTILVKKFGTDTKNWIGAVVDIVVKEQNVRGDDKLVIYAENATKPANADPVLKELKKEQPPLTAAQAKRDPNA